MKIKTSDMDIYELYEYIRNGDYRDILEIEERFPWDKTNVLFKEIVSGILKRVKEKKEEIARKNIEMRKANIPFKEREELMKQLVYADVTEKKFRKHVNMLPYKEWIKPFDIESLNRLGMNDFIINHYPF